LPAGPARTHPEGVTHRRSRAATWAPATTSGQAENVRDGDVHPDTAQLLDDDLKAELGRYDAALLRIMRSLDDEAADGPRLFSMAPSIRP
jgi:hypothetical protein